MLHKFLFSVSCLLLSGTIFSQDWANKLADPSVNFYEVQKSFSKYWKKEERKEKFKSFFSIGPKTEEGGEGYTMYKRWENFVEPRVYPSGDRSLLKNTGIEMEKLIRDHSYRASRQAGGNWQPMGPFVVPTSRGGAGRLNCVRFHPTNVNTIYVGAPAGGLWITTNGGATWSTATDQLPSLGVSDVAIDPVDPNIMYLGTGDIDAGDTYGIGVLKSIDAGATWSITGLSFVTVQGRNVNRVMISPADHNMIFAATTIGVFRSLDAGVTWTRVLNTSNIKDFEFKPGTPSTLYCTSNASLFRSVNNGTSWTALSTGLPTAATVSRLAIAVTPANPDYIYIVYSETGSNTFKAVYRTTNGGTSFSLMADSPNLLGYDTDGMDSGGQGWYTLAIAASPVNADEVIVGGVNVWRSVDGGSSFEIVSHWYGGGGVPYIHADIHDLIYRPGTSQIFAGNDGGIFRSTNGGTSWTDLSAGLNIGQMYRLGGSFTNPDMVTQGWQDNGTNLYLAGVWDRILGGDGMETFIDWSNANYVYGESQNGGLSRSSNAGDTFTDITSGISENGAWITPWQQDPAVSTTIYAGFENVWKSTNRGNSWSLISNLNTQLTSLAVAPSNSQYIYASNGTQVFKTTNGGTSWTTHTVPMGGTNTITYLAVSTADPNKIWITRSGYTVNNKVYRSSDGGVTWSNLSTGLPNIPVNCVVNQTGTNDGIYVGTDVGVYYIDNTLSSWMPYMNGLPNVIVDELEIHYGAGKLRAATYGRGLWETGIYDPASPDPFPNFTGDVLSGCPGFSVQFSDSTTNSPTAWEWTFPGGTPGTSNLQNPIITYNTPGTYHNVTLKVWNASGNDSITKYSYIAVSPQVIPTISLNNNDSICQGQNVLLTSSVGNLYTWHPTNASSFTQNVNTTGTFSVTVTDVFGCAMTSDSVHITVFPLPATPVITQIGDTLYSSSSTDNQWYYNGSLIGGATGQSHVITAPGNYYTVVTVDSSGCSATSNTLVGITEENGAGVGLSIYPNPSEGSSVLTLVSDHVTEPLIRITDVLGKLVYENKLQPFSGKQEIRIDLSNNESGVYLLRVITDKGTVTRKMIVK